VLLPDGPERCGGKWHSCFERRQEPDSNVGIADPTQAQADAPEAIGNVIVVVVSQLGEWEKDSNPPRRDPDIMNFANVAIEDSRQVAQQRLRLALQDRGWCRELKHNRPRGTGSHAMLVPLPGHHVHSSSRLSSQQFRLSSAGVPYLRRHSTTCSTAARRYRWNTAKSIPACETVFPHPSGVCSNATTRAPAFSAEAEERQAAGLKADV
jgi:hypothetical protein